MSNKLVVSVIGNQNSGKTSTWKELFGRTVKTGTKLRQLYLNKTEYVEVFLVSGSAEEREKYIGDLITEKNPRIVLCSMQYIESVKDTFNYFVENEYTSYTQWLNPGYKDQKEVYFDSLGLVNWLLNEEHILSMRNGKINLKDRVQEIRDHIYGWAKNRNLILT